MRRAEAAVSIVGLGFTFRWPVRALLTALASRASLCSSAKHNARARSLQERPARALPNFRISNNISNRRQRQAIARYVSTCDTHVQHTYVYNTCVYIRIYTVQTGRLTGQRTQLERSGAKQSSSAAADQIRESSRERAEQHSKQ